MLSTMWASISACLIGVTGACEDRRQLGAPRLADGAPAAPGEGDLDRGLLRSFRLKVGAIVTSRFEPGIRELMVDEPEIIEPLLICRRHLSGIIRQGIRTGTFFIDVTRVERAFLPGR
jgi:hypothetical protein